MPCSSRTSCRGLKASHLDFYRFNDPREWVDAGLREVFAQPGLKLAEWPDKAGVAAARAGSAVAASRRTTMATRDVAVHANTPRGVELLA